jgi:hypothetical protein
MVVSGEEFPIAWVEIEKCLVLEGFERGEGANRERWGGVLSVG